MTNLEWIKTLNLPQEIKERLKYIATLANGSGWLAIKMNHKIKELRGLSELKIMEIWELIKDLQNFQSNNSTLELIRDDLLITLDDSDINQFLTTFA